MACDFMQTYWNNTKKHSNVTKSQENSLVIFRYVINLARIQKVIIRNKITTSMSKITPPL